MLQIIGILQSQILYLLKRTSFDTIVGFGGDSTIYDQNENILSFQKILSNTFFIPFPRNSSQWVWA